MINDDLLTIYGNVAGHPISHDLIIRDDNELLICVDRSRNADSECGIRRYRVLGDSIDFSVNELNRANVEVILVEEFGLNALTTDERLSNQRLVQCGVLIAVAVDRKPAIAAWLYVRGHSPDEIAEQIGIDN